MKTLKSIIMLCCLLMASGIAKAQSSHWTCDERSFEYSMSLYISASLYHNDITDFGNYEIGAFCGEECRGLLSIQNTSDVEYGYLRIRSNVMNGESITFNLYDKQNDKVISCDSIVPFVANSRIGYPSEPYHLNFGRFIPGDVNDDGKILLNDATMIINYVIGKSQSNFNQSAADLNGDGMILLNDATMIINKIIGK